MKRFFPFFLLALLLAEVTLVISHPQSAGALPDARAESVRARILELMKERKVPSLAIAVAHNGKVLYEECFGFANLEKKIRATPETLYPLASLSKPMTATGLMILVERGLVDLDRPANDYLGENKITAYVGDASGATIRRLLHCTAGLPQHWNIYYEDEKSLRLDMEESMRRYGFLVTAPGEVYTYSNLGYGILAHIIERVSGKSYAEFMEAEVFEPLGMKRSAVFVGPPSDDRAALKYTGNQRPVPFSDYDHRGASAAYASLRDLLRFAAFTAKRPLQDQKRILEDKTIDMMIKSRDPDVPNALLRLGWAVIDHEGYSFVHGSGGMPGASSRLTMIPAERLTSIVLANCDTLDLWEVEKAVLMAYLPGYAEKAKAEKPAPAPEAQTFVPPESLWGAWDGTIKTYEGDVPVKLTVAADGNVRFELYARVLQPFQIPAAVVDWKLDYRNGFFTAPFFANLKTSDTARASHILYAVLKLRADRLSGYILAAAMDQRFGLPYWIELVRPEGD